MAGEAPTKPSGAVITEKKYELSGEELQFYQKETGIHDEELLREHIEQVQKDAFAIYPYPCIEAFRFLNCGMRRMSVYQHVLRLGRERKGAILLDVGCCFGNEARRAAADGFPAEQIVASDIEAGFWDLGHKLFKSTPESCTITFVPGDIFELVSLAASVAPTSREVATYPDIETLMPLTTLNPLSHKISAIFAANFFHLFDEENQLALAKRLAVLLSPEPGSIIFGAHIGADTKQMRNDHKRSMFCHSSKTWSEMWEEQVFNKGEVNCKCFFYAERPTLIWSVERI